MTKLAIPVLAGIFATLTVFSFDAHGQQRIASIQGFVGDVDIEHSAQIIKPLKIGRMIRNGDVFDTDTLRTRKGEADLLVVDGSAIRMDQNTSIYVAFETIQPATGAPAPAQGEVDRKVRLLVGRIWSDVKPSRTTTTKFELPDGVAAVRGTVVEFGVTPTKAWDAAVVRGVMSLMHTKLNAQMSLASGNKVGAVALGTTTSLQALPETGGLIKNSDFTSRAAGKPSQPTEWKLPAGDSGWSVTNAGGHSGKDALRYERTQARLAEPVTQEVPCRPNTEYILSAWLKSDGVLKPLVRVTAAGMPDPEVVSDGSTQWTRFTTRFTSGNAKRFLVQIFASVEATKNNPVPAGRAEIDDVQVLPAVKVEGDTAQLTNLGDGAIDVLLADGSRITGFDPAEVVDVTRYPDGSYLITVVQGSVSYTDASGKTTTVNQGELAGAAVALGLQSFINRHLESAAVVGGYVRGGTGGGLPAARIGGGSGGGGTTSNNDSHQPFE